MKPEKKGSGFLALSRQAALIIAFGTSIWCLVSEVSLIETLFRATVVYLSIVIISYLVSHFIVRSLSHQGDVDVVEPSVDSGNDIAQ